MTVLTQAVLKRLLVNSAAIFGGEAMARLATFLVAIIVARHFGPVALGQYGYALGCASILLLVPDFGLHLYAVRELSADPTRLRIVFWSMQWLKLLLVSVLLLFTFLFGRWGSLDGGRRVLLYILVGRVVLQTFFQGCMAVFKASEQMHHIAVQQFLNSALVAVWIAAALAQHGDPDRPDGFHFKSCRADSDIPERARRRATGSLSGKSMPMKTPVLFLEQQSWLSGAQRVLEVVLDSIASECDPIVAFPNQGPFCQTLQDRGIETFLIPLGDYRSGPKSYSEILAFPFRSLWCGLKLASIIRRRGIKLVYINGPRCLRAGVLAAYLTGCPSVFHLHLTLSRKPEVKLVTDLARFVWRIVACSGAAVQPLLESDSSLRGKIRILYNPVIAQTSQTNPVQTMPAEPDLITLGMVGRITESKGLRVLMEAVGMLRPELRQKVRLVFVGDTAPGDAADLAYALRVKYQVARLQLENQIVWAGYQPDPVPFYKSMDVLVRPSSAQSGEALPLAILEAFSEGVPVIATRTGGIPEIVQDGFNSLLVSPRDELALAQALQQFIEDAPLRCSPKGRGEN